MLMAILYSNDGEILAAAPACDQLESGDEYWNEYHVGEFELRRVLETAYVQVNDEDLCEQLMRVGIDDEIDVAALAGKIESAGFRKPFSLNRAA